MKLLIGIFLIGIFSAADGRCSRGCDLAYASYYVWSNSNLSFISHMLQTPIRTILDHNRQISNQDSVLADTRINVPFTCDCLRGGEFLGHDFTYMTSPGDTYELIAGTYYSNLTTIDWLQKNNIYPAWNIPDTGVALNVTVNCTCGDKHVSPDYGLFVTYPLRTGESLESVAAAANLSVDLVRSYNPTANSSSGSGLVFIPARDQNGSFRPLNNSSWRPQNTRFCWYSDGASPGLAAITVDKSVEFSYEELASATDDFSIANKIGEGGFGAVYYAELRGEKAAIKKMDMQASKEFLAELKVLTNVHHLNLVRLIGYCIEGSLFLVYEYIENGNLSQHLRGSGREPLPWATRVQIALDSARGLEYIHEHTVPVYIHRDIKPANILIDKNFHAKFEEVLSKPDPTEELRKLVDPRLGDKYPSTPSKRVCTHENPQLRPTMRSIVVALMTLSSTTEDWDIGSFYGNHGLLNLMSGR
ncbi:Chitin elicitor receptor kinase [Sesamum angolense]|uniref:Chitin elicitor receptor kinase n=1 Tax=Sesamum angolense TaxID=2727404 RepID=A0AAE1W417_9LAMI|nr:Chitin elicitor receptor kinase [Sesamum angolense]